MQLVLIQAVSPSWCVYIFLKAACLFMKTLLLHLQVVFTQRGTLFFPLPFLQLIVCDAERLIPLLPKQYTSAPSPRRSLPQNAASSWRVDAISPASRVTISNSGGNLWQGINRKRHPYFLSPHSNSISSSIDLQELLSSPSPDNQRGIIFSLFFTFPSP